MTNEHNRIDRFADTEDSITRQKILKLLGFFNEERLEKILKFMLKQVGEQVTGVKKDELEDEGQEI